MTARLLLAATLLLGACAPAEEGDVRRGSPAAPTPEAVAPSASAVSQPTPAARDVAVLVLELSEGGLRVFSTSLVARERLGASARFNGKGRVTHRYRLVSATGESLDEGDVAAQTDAHVPPGPAGPAAHVPLPTFAFTVRAPQPAEGEHLEIVSVNDKNIMVSWP